MRLNVFNCLRSKKKKPYDLSYSVSSNENTKKRHSSSSFDEERDSSDGFGIRVFSYNELKEATNDFDYARQIGEGGFGSVYHGMLRDGREVAVKHLYPISYTKTRPPIDEVEILSRLRHRNLVSLYGCTSLHSDGLVLVFEYIPNGTLADHLHGKRAETGALPWPTRMKIAAEIASGLAYLHASDIIHRDVKTKNILLDNQFHVKIADFGLSCLFPIDVTHISTIPKGTPGYVDPEYCRSYQLTDKSDVYSFGVILIELISSMPAIDVTRHRHEIRLSDMAVTKIQNMALHQLVDLNLGYESDFAAKKMITAVAELGYQCLQIEKELRPSMEEVLQTLEDIEEMGHNLEKAEALDAQSDDVGMSKRIDLPISPDSVMINWNSTSITRKITG